VTPRTLVLAISALALGAGPAFAQEDAETPLTRPERTGWVETSSYLDVMGFLAEVAGGDIAVDTFGYSLEGRALPVARWGNGPTRILVFANIHAGEVEGKEAGQILLRELAAGEHAAWRDALTLLIAPIYNADGNERVTLTNRPLQLGPVGGMGQRPNGQGLDLNRDFTKLDAPETRSLIGLMREVDPHVIVDLHTTNGTYHAYHLTYAPPLHPGTDAGIDRYLRETWLPAVTRELAPRWLTYYYGNLPEAGVDGADDAAAPRAWYTFDHRPRFSTNYVGLRNRFGILSEAYAYLPFEERIEATRRFVESLLDFAAAHGEELRRIAEQADSENLVGQELPLHAEPARSADEVEILMGAVIKERHPHTGRPMLRRLDVVRPERMPEYGRFQATESGRVPAAYLIPAALEDVLDVLGAHGIRSHALTAAETREVEIFGITGSTRAESEFQGHHARTLEGSWARETREVPVGTNVVPMDQPLARLAFVLLEPRSDDGLVVWSLLDPALEGAATYPILRVPAP
jgi:hypothetical protein